MCVRSKENTFQSIVEWIWFLKFWGELLRFLPFLKDCSKKFHASTLNTRNLCLLTAHTQAFKVAVMKSLLKKSILDWFVLANYKPILNFPFISGIIEKVVVKWLTDPLQRNRGNGLECNIAQKQHPWQWTDPARPRCYVQHSVSLTTIFCCRD